MLLTDGAEDTTVNTFKRTEQDLHGSAFLRNGPPSCTSDPVSNAAAWYAAIRE